MSYILDAIKKSEAERGTGSIPSLQTVHSSSLSYNTDSKPLWPYILIVLLLLNLIGVIYFVLNRQDNTMPIATSTNTSTNKFKNVSANKVQPQNTIPTISSNQVIATNKIITARKQTDLETIITVPDKAENLVGSESLQTSTSSPTVLSIDQLPTYIKQRIPTLDFSGHVYSTSPTQRSIIINGSFFEEGDAINHEFELTEITPRGAVFAYEDTLFEISVLTGWSAN